MPAVPRPWHAEPPPVLRPRRWDGGRRPAVPRGGQLVAGGEEARLAGRRPHHFSGQGLWSRAGPAARATGNDSRGTDRMKDVAAWADEEHMSRGRVTVRSLYPAG